MKSLFDAPSRITIPKANGGKDWIVNNAEPSSGVLDLVDATKESSNTVYAQLMVKVRPENVVPVAQSMGITTKLDPFVSLVLGSEEVFPLDMASGYSTWAHRGEHITPTAILKVERPDGTVVAFDQPRAQVLTQQQSDLVTYCLQQVVHGGTGSGAFFGKEIAGKTGTTEDNTDAWFVGFTPNGYTTAVWMGYDNAPGQPPRFMNNVHGRVVFGGTFPATIWHKYMQGITDRDGRRQLLGPEVVPRQGPQRGLDDDDEHDGDNGPGELDDDARADDAYHERGAAHVDGGHRDHRTSVVPDGAGPAAGLSRLPRAQSSGSAAPTGWWG